MLSIIINDVQEAPVSGAGSADSSGFGELGWRSPRSADPLLPSPPALSKRASARALGAPVSLEHFSTVYNGLEQIVPCSELL